MDAAWSALVIDDDPGVRQSLRLCLESDHARVVGTGTRSGTLNAIERNRFDVVFLDLWLQSESGLSLLPEMMRRQAGVGVIVITAFASFDPLSRQCDLALWITSPSRSRPSRLGRQPAGW